MPGSTNMIAPTGEVVSVADDGYAAAINAGYKPEADDAAFARVKREGELANYSGAAQTLKAGVMAGLRTASLGLTDVAYGDAQDLKNLREAHPTADTLGTIAGFAATLPAGGEGALAEAARLTPAGMVAAKAARIAEAGAEAGTIGKVAAIAKAGAYEGAYNSVGSYISDVALEDKDLSAEGFLGAVGHGALWGGAVGGAIGGLERGTVAARRLFPRSAVGDAGAVEVAEKTAAQTLDQAAAVAPKLVQSAKAKIEELALTKAQISTSAAAQREALRSAQGAQRLETQKALDAIRLEKAAARGTKAAVPEATAGEHFAGAEDTLARQAGHADVEAAAAHASIDADTAAAHAAHDADISRIQGMAEDVSAKEAEVRALLAEGQTARPASDPFRLPASPRQDLAARYDDAIAKLSSGSTRAESEAALAEAAQAEKAIFDDALSAGGSRMKQAQEILDARAEAGVDHAYSAARRMEKFGTAEHLPAVTEVERGMAKLGPQGPPTLEELLQGTKAQLDRGATIGEVGAIGKGVTAERQTWREFTKGKMGPYMKSEGGHAGAMSRLSTEWKAYQAEGAAGVTGGRFTGDAAKAVKVIGDYEKSVADLARELGDKAPAEAQAMGKAYDAAVERATSKQTRNAANAIDDAAANPMPTRMTKDEIAAWKDRARVRDEASAIKAGRRAEYAAETPDLGTGSSHFTSKTTVSIDAEGKAIDWAKLSPAERTAKRLEVEHAQALGQMNRKTIMDAVLDGKQSVADIERLSGRKLSADELIDMSREQSLGVIDDAKEAKLREMMGERVIKPAAAEAAPAAAPEAAAPAAEGPPVADIAKEAVNQAAPSAKKQPIGAAINENATRAAHGEQKAMAAYEAAPEKALAATQAVPTLAEKAAGKFGKVADVAAALEAARAMGIPGIPDVRDIPVVGPLLSMYLKARAARAVWSRMGGRIPESVEAKIATKSAELRDRAAHAVDTALGLTGKGAMAVRGVASASAPKAGDAIMHALYPSPDGKKAATPANVREAAAMRATELAAATSSPDALKAAVRAQVPTSDADLGEAIQAAITRKLAYLQKAAPPIPPPDPMNRKPPPVSTAAATAFARVVRVAEDPVSALHDLAAGTLTSDQADALKAIYPRLYGEVQSRVFAQAAKFGSEIPYRTRVRLSVLFGAALDPSIGSIASLQADQPPAQELPSATPSAQPPQPPVPSVAGAPNLTALYQTGADKRASK